MQRYPVDIYRVVPGKNNNWIRVFVRTQHSAPARGALVRVVSKAGVIQTRIIDNGSGYLCQMEPVAHFGLGSDEAVKIYVQWPDGLFVTREGANVTQKTLYTIDHPDRYDTKKYQGRIEL